MHTRAARHTVLQTLPTNVLLVGQSSPDAQRRGRYAPASVQAHPGKMLPELARRLITSYTRPGEWVLDPMSGIGTTGVEAVELGRNYVGVELEPRFADFQRQNLAAATDRGARGQWDVIEGDARRLRDLSAGARTVTPGPVDAVITSPPYVDRLDVRQHRPLSPILTDLIARGVFSADVLPKPYGTEAGNIGNCAGPEYFAAMEAVYAGCFDVLKPGGRLIIVLQPGRKRWRYEPLHHVTARLCHGLGFTLIDELVACLGRVAVSEDGVAEVVAHSGLWRRLAIARSRRAGWPVTLNQVEYVLVFTKPVASRVPAKPKTAVRPLLPISASAR